MTVENASALRPARGARGRVGGGRGGGGRVTGGRVTGGKVAANALALGLAVFFAFPVLWMFVSAVRPQLEIVQGRILPDWSHLTLANFGTAIHRPFFGDYVRNSLVVTLTTVALAIVVALLAATAIARMRFRGRTAVVLLVMIIQVAPFEALLIPYFLFMRDLQLVNKLPALVLIYFTFTLPFTVYNLRGFILAVPVELEEAAWVDGCSRPQAFWRVVFPLLAPGLVATSIYSFITAWNEFLYAFVLMQDSQRYTLPVWLSTFSSAFGTDWGGTMAAATLFTLPVLIFFLIVQRHLVSGMTAGAVKG